MEIRVIDTGIGINEKNLNFIFDEYVKIENATGKKYSGTGLGLSIVKKLVELQGGKIKLESNPGKGTTVTVNINYREGDSANLKQLINEAIEIPESFKKLSVLIADDEEYNRFLLKSILQKWGLRFKEAKNGIEVVNAAHNEHFDLILMDLNMPEMNGIEAAKAVTQSSPDIIIVAVTAANDEADQQECFKAGMKGFLFKPFSEKDLFEKINSVIRSNSEINQSVDLKDQINISEFSRLAGGDDKFLAEMIQLFIKSMESGIAGIEDAIKTEKWNAVYENAHKMAAPLKHIGASQLYGKVKQLEKISQEPATIASVSPVFRGIKFEIEKLNAMLKSHIV
jgi:CheY-like chemotaxis protein